MSGFEQIAKQADKPPRRWQQIIGNFRTGLAGPAHRVALPRTESGQRDRIRYLAVLWIIGAAALAGVTWLGVLVDFNRPGAAILAYLIVIMLLSLMDSFITSAVFSVAAVLCLNYFFVEPRYSFTVDSTQDLIALASFLVISLAITALVRRVRYFGEIQAEHGDLLEVTTDAVFALDPNRVITYWNRGAEQLYGFTRAEAIGKVKHHLLKTVFPAPLEDIIRTFHRDGRWEGELVHTTSTGERVTVASRWSLQRDNQGRIIGALESNTDITQRKEAEEALRRSQAAYFAEAQRLSRTGSFGWNLSSGRIVWSEETYRIFEFDPSIEPTVELVLGRVHPDDAALVRGVIDRAVADRETFDFEHRLLMPDGSVKHVHIVARAVDGAPQQFVGAIMDVTDLVMAEDKLQRLQAEFAHAARVSTLGELTTSIAHELNQPLGAIAAGSEAALLWLDRPVPNHDEVRSSLKRIHGDAKRASEIISRIRAMAVRKGPQRTLVSIDDLIREVLQFLQHEVQSRRVVVSHHLALAAPLVLADRTQMQQVIVNLCVNAVQAMTQTAAGDRKLAIRTTAPDGTTVCCTIEDSGTGIKPEHLPRLFESFFTTREGGMGMGLSICRSIVEAHGGRISADNDSVHGGARFSFKLPAAAPPLA